MHHLRGAMEYRQAMCSIPSLGLLDPKSLYKVLRTDRVGCRGRGRARCLCSLRDHWAYVGPRLLLFTYYYGQMLEHKRLAVNVYI